MATYWIPRPLRCPAPPPPPPPPPPSPSPVPAWRAKDGSLHATYDAAKRHDLKEAMEEALYKHHWSEYGCSLSVTGVVRTILDNFDVTPKGGRK